MANDNLDRLDPQASRRPRALRFLRWLADTFGPAPPSDTTPRALSALRQILASATIVVVVVGPRADAPATRRAFLTPDEAHLYEVMN